MNDNYLLMRYLGMSMKEINALESYRKNSYVNAIKDNKSSVIKYKRKQMIKRLF
jgi:hypothetical protein